VEAAGLRPPQPEPVTAQLRAALLAAPAPAEGRSLELRLDPPELGRVTVSFEAGRDGALAALVAAERPETLDLLRRNAEILQRELAQAGWRGAELQFAGGGPSGERAAAPPPDTPPAGPPSAATPPGLPDATRRAAAALARTGGGLDLRL
jgi:hypothetical protein